MADLSNFDPNSAGNPNNNIFGLPFSEEESRVVILPVPWEVSVSYKAGTSRAPESIFKASFQVDLIDNDIREGWKQGIFMKEQDKSILQKSDYLRKEAELYIKYVTEGQELDDSKFMCKSIHQYFNWKCGHKIFRENFIWNIYVALGSNTFNL